MPLIMISEAKFHRKTKNQIFVIVRKGKKDYEKQYILFDFF